MSSLPLKGKVAVVTGVSRSAGIAMAVARRLVDDGASVFATGWPSHDEQMPWGSTPRDDGDLPAERYRWEPADLADATTPATLLDDAAHEFGPVDIVVAAHAQSSSNGLATVTAEELDACWAVNARASVLLAQALDRHHDGQRPGGRLVLFTSGQHLGPMDGEIAYAVSKGAIHQMTASLANAVADKGITVNTINPGPVDTGWATGQDYEDVRSAFPQGRWGQPTDSARIVAWLVSGEGDWISGQVINSEGGWRRS